jgi:hypothetical protein
MTTGSRESDVSPQDPGARGAIAHEDLALGGIWKADRQRGSNNDPTTAEIDDNLDDQIRLESWKGKKSVIASAGHVPQGKRFTH